MAFVEHDFKFLQVGNDVWTVLQARTVETWIGLIMTLIYSSSRIQNDLCLFLDIYIYVYVIY